jgi:uncharacterized membrane protein YgaE (UPF0421/DUF939 family)
MSAVSSSSGTGGDRGSALRDFLRGGADRLRDRGWPVLQTAVAVGLAWYLASVIFGHERPVFASIAALISLGVAVGRQWKRAVQVILGVGSGIALASFLVLAVGAGPLQMVLVVGLALGAAVFFGAEPLLITQVGISAITAWRPRASACSRPNASSTR